MERKRFNTILHLLYQRSLLLLGAGTILAFIALYIQPHFRQAIYIGWGILFTFILLWKLLSWYLSPPKNVAQNKDIVDIFTKITTALLLVLSITLTWLGISKTQEATEKNLELAKVTLENNLAQQIDERFTRALEKVGGKTSWERIAGLLSLKRIDAQLSNEKDPSLQQSAEKDHWEIMRILTDFIQENAPWKEGGKLQPRGDIQTTLSIIGERKFTFKNREDKRLNLVGTDLRGYLFKEGYNFEGASFRQAHLEGANLTGLNLAGAIFKEAHLEGANLNKADLTGAELLDAHLEGADLTGATGIKEYELNTAITDSETKCPPTFKQQSGKCVKDK